MRWKIWWTGEQKTRATIHSLKSLPGWSSFQERGTWISWSIIFKKTHELPWNDCTWHEVVDLTFFGQWANLLDHSPIGQELVTDGWLDWFHPLITQITTGNILMWLTRLGIVDWVSSKTQILLVTLGIQNQPRKESYVSLEVEQFFL